MTMKNFEDMNLEKLSKVCDKYENFRSNIFLLLVLPS